MPLTDAAITKKVGQLRKSEGKIYAPLKYFRGLDNSRRVLRLATRRCSSGTTKDSRRTKGQKDKDFLLHPESSGKGIRLRCQVAA
jgi:hypothetical protein